MGVIAVGLSPSSPIDDLLDRINFLTPHQEAGVRLYLPDKTVQDLLEYGTAQALADDLEREAREQYLLSLEEQNKSSKAKSVDEFLENDAPLRLKEMGDVAYRLLLHVHRMFNSVDSSLQYTYIPR